MMRKSILLSLFPATLLCVAPSADARETSSETNMSRCINHMVETPSRKDDHLKGIEIYGDNWTCKGYRRIPNPGREVLSRSFPAPKTSYTFAFSKERTLGQDYWVNVWVEFGHYTDPVNNERSCRFRITYSDRDVGSDQTLPRGWSKHAMFRDWKRVMQSQRAGYKDSRSRSWDWKRTGKWMAIGLAHAVIPDGCQPLRGR